MMNKSTIRFVQEHLNDDVHILALQTRRDSSIDLPWALDQIQGRQTAYKKLPSWASIDSIIYPPHLSMEQCSSEQTALYKCDIIDKLPSGSHKTLVDLTGGFGVDFAFMARHAEHAVYVERQEHLCQTAKHNFEQLGLNKALVINTEAECFLKEMNTDPASTLLYLDPARRDNNSSRTYAIADCTPNVLEMKDKLLKAAHHIMLKLSPMLDWHKAVNELGCQVAEVHIVSTSNECKELLILMTADHDGEPTIHCTNDEHSLVFKPSMVAPMIRNGNAGRYLYEPNASIMKAGCYSVLTERYPIAAIADDSHLFVSDTEVADFPGRSFCIKAITTMNKKQLAHAMAGITHANVATRNFPMTAHQLRSRLRLKDGGDIYIFGTTTTNKQHVLILCQKLIKT